MSITGRTVCCPAPATLESAVTELDPCRQDIGQIIKFIFWRRGNSIASVATATLTATWTDLFEATDDTKALQTPFVADVQIPLSEAREFGSGNEVRSGSTKRKGSNPVEVTAKIYNADQDTITILKELVCESLDVFLVNESFQIMYYEGSAGSVVGGFEVVNRSLWISDKKIGGLDDADYNSLTFNLKPNWSNKLKIIE